MYKNGDFKMKKEKLFYQCYSKNQKEFLVSKGCSILLTAKHIVTDKQFWCFMYNEELNKYLTEWTNKSNL